MHACACCAPRATREPPILIARGVRWGGNGRMGMGAGREGGGEGERTHKEEGSYLQL